jgi:MFS family permease
LSFSIARDEFPRERVAGAIGLLSSILGVGGGIGLVVGALIVEHLGIHWLFWVPLVVTVIAAYATWRWIPESPIKSPGTINWIAAVLMSVGITLVLIAIAQTTTWGWGSPKTLVMLFAGLLVIAAWVGYEVRSANPLIDMAMMRIRGVWTTNLAAFLLGAGMYASFLLYPEFAQLPKSTGFGFGASTLVSSLYLLPCALLMAMLGSLTGAVNRRFGSRFALIAGSLITALGFLWMAVIHGHPYDMLISAALLGVGIGLAFSSLGNLIVGAVEPHQTGVASGINTVMRTLGGALGGQIAATFVSDNHTFAGIPTVTGFTLSFWMATVFLVVTAASGALVPSDRSAASKVAVAA